MLKVTYYLHSVAYQRLNDYLKVFQVKGYTYLVNNQMFHDNLLVLYPQTIGTTEACSLFRRNILSLCLPYMHISIRLLKEDGSRHLCSNLTL
jgi:hypothetical protein